MSGSIGFDKTHTLFLLNYQIGHDKSSLWEYPELLFNFYSLTMSWHSGFSLEDLWSLIVQGKRGLGFCLNSFYLADPDHGGVVEIFTLI